MTLRFTLSGVQTGFARRARCPAPGFYRKHSMHKNLFLAVSMTIGAIVLAVGSAGAGAAAYGDTSPLYAGAAVGRMQYKVACALGGECRLHDNGSGKVYAGFSFAPASLWQGSELTSSAEVVGYYGGKVHLNEQFPGFSTPYTESFRGGALMYKASIRESQALSLHVRAGVSHLTGKLTLKGADYATRKSTETAPAFGLGVSYALGRQWALNADYDRLRVTFAGPATDTVHMFTLGAAFKF